MNLVVDCSFIMSSLLPEEQKAPIDYDSYKIYVPSIFYLECNNVLISALNRKRITELDFQEYLELLRDLPVIVDRFSSSPESLYFIAKLSKEHSLSAYNASYLELTIRLNAKIATYDKSLMSACFINKIEFIS